MSTRSRLPWPDAAPVLPVEPLRGVLEAFSSLALRHPEDVTLLPPLVDEDGNADESADPPPALEQIVEEFGGIEVRGRVRLNLLTDDRTDLGPYTLLGDPTTFYPLIEGDDVAVILTIDEDGTPGAVYGIGEDLSLTLASRSLGHFLERYLHALTETLEGLDAEAERASAGAGDSGEAGNGAGAGTTAAPDRSAAPDGAPTRAESAVELMKAHMLSSILGLLPEEERAAVPIESVADSGFEADDLPEGTVAVADLRDVDGDASVHVMDADLPGDPLECRIAFSHGGLVVSIVDEEAGEE